MFYPVLFKLKRFKGKDKKYYSATRLYYFWDILYPLEVIFIFSMQEVSFKDLQLRFH